MLFTHTAIDENQIKRKNVAAVILNERNEVLYCQRAKSKKFLPEMWHLPGGKIEANETPEAALRREILEELSLSIDFLENSNYSHLYLVDSQLHCTFFYFAKVSGTIQLDFENQAFAFVKISDLKNYLEEHVLQINTMVCEAALQHNYISLL